MASNSKNRLPAEALPVRSIGLASILLISSLAWVLAAKHLLLQQSLARDESALKQSEAVFMQARENTRSTLKIESQLLADDPRLRSALGTPGIDEATILDILVDLKKVTGADLLAVLSPSGRVQAVAGAETFRGLDLGSSAIVKSVSSSEKSVTGSWVIEDRLIDLGASAMRYGDQAIAYLMVGSYLDKKALVQQHQITDVGVGVVIGGKLTMFEPDRAEDRAGFEWLSSQTPSTDFKVFEQIEPSPLLGAIAEVPGALPPSRIVWSRRPESLLPSQQPLQLLLWGPTLAALTVWCVVMFQTFVKK